MKPEGRGRPRRSYSPVKKDNIGRDTGRIELFFRYAVSVKPDRFPGHLSGCTRAGTDGCTACGTLGCAIFDVSYALVFPSTRPIMSTWNDLLRVYNLLSCISYVRFVPRWQQAPPSSAFCYVVYVMLHLCKTSSWKLELLSLMFT